MRHLINFPFCKAEHESNEAKDIFLHWEIYTCVRTPIHDEYLLKIYVPLIKKMRFEIRAGVATALKASHEYKVDDE